MPNGANMILGQVNTASSPTRLNQTGSSPGDALVVTSHGFGGNAVAGHCASESRADAAVLGSGTAYAAGVRGRGTYGQGVKGEAKNAGVEGISSDSAGVVGEAQVYSGVHGSSRAPYGTGGGPGAIRFGEGVGVRGLGGNAGVEGYTGAGVGVWARALSGIGVRGVSTDDSGVFGSSEGFAGLAGISASRWFGAYAQAWRGTGLVAVGRRGLYAEGRPAAELVGDLVVHGNVIASGWKAAALSDADGSHRLLYAIESPEARFEDFGRATLRRGRAQVALDPTFAGVVRTGDYHVFLTAEGDCRGLYVARRTSRGFEVREQGGGRSRTRFSYRVVATRKDVRTRRFARVALPKAALPRAKDLPPALRRQAGSGELALGDVGRLMANAWGSKAAAAPVPHAAKRQSGTRRRADRAKR
jgi:hypothetical protein